MNAKYLICVNITHSFDPKNGKPKRRLVKYPCTIKEYLSIKDFGHKIINVYDGSDFEYMKLLIDSF